MVWCRYLRCVHEGVPTLSPCTSGYQVASSAKLQMWLYFNVWYAIVFVVLLQLLFAWKVCHADQTCKSYSRLLAHCSLRVPGAHMASVDGG